MKKRKKIAMLTVLMVLFTLLLPYHALASDVMHSDDMKISELHNATAAGLNNFRNEKEPLPDEARAKLEGMESDLRPQEDGILGDGIPILYEIEPNNSMNQANIMNPALCELGDAIIVGDITGHRYDVDYFQFEIERSGDLLSIGQWIGDYYQYGWEDDLIFGILDSNGNVIVASYNFFQDYYGFHIDISPGTYYLVVMADDSYGDLYVNEPYSIGLFFESEPISVDKIEVTQLPDKVHYLLGEPFDPSGGILRAIENSTGNYNDFPLIESMVSGFDPMTLGKQTLDVYFEGKTTDFDVYVNRFTDVPYGHQVYNYVNRLADTGIINGYSDGTFRPNNNITRAQAAVMIVRAADIDTSNVESDFNDVPESHSAYRFISAAYQAGIINGYSEDNTYRPSELITRGQIAVMLTRAFDLEEGDDPVDFTDVPKSHRQYQFIRNLSSNGIINGYSDGTFRPTDNTRRGQFSVMVDRLIH